MNDESASARFRSIVLSNLDAAHNLAWWLTRNEHDAADVVQDACVKAWRFFGDFRGEGGVGGADGKAWLLRIVRTTAATIRRGSRERPISLEAAGADTAGPERRPDPGASMALATNALAVNEAIESLPEPLREILILRDVEGLSYAQIATVLEAPPGTVMSRLSRARDALRDAMLARGAKE